MDHFTLSQLAILVAACGLNVLFLGIGLAVIIRDQPRRPLLALGGSALQPHWLSAYSGRAPR